MEKNNKKVIVAMSGGVDSSVAAQLLVNEGYHTAGIFLNFWKEREANLENKCCAPKALMDARRVCLKLKIPLYTLDFSRIFKKEIVDYFLSEYKIGRTPNPCVRCNKFIKLGLLIKKAKALGYDKVATGHYTILKKDRNQIYNLYGAKDKTKDQSYFLYTLGQEELSRLMFPLGNYTKIWVRKLAQKYKLPVASKPESQEVCFVPEKSHNEFLKRHLKLKRGDIIDIDSTIKIGTHNGLPLYTIGQRKGIPLSGQEPYYVVDINAKKNYLLVSQNAKHPLLNKKSLTAVELNWISGRVPKMPFYCEAAIRYKHKKEKAKIIKGDRKNEVKVLFNFPQRAITPGQSVVFYNKNKILGGGIIK